MSPAAALLPRSEPVAGANKNMALSKKARKALAKSLWEVYGNANGQGSNSGSNGDTAEPRKAQQDADQPGKPKEETVEPGKAQDDTAQPGKPKEDTAQPGKPQEDTAQPVGNGNDQFLESLLQTLHKMWLHLRRLAEFVMSELGGNEIVESMAAWCAKNPHIAICLLAAGLVFLLPFLIIFGFGIATMVMTFTGLLVLEGTLLTIVSMVFFACLGGFVIIVPIFGVAAVAAYFGFAQVYGLYDGIERHKGKILGEPQSKPRPESPPASVITAEEPTSTT